MTFVLPLTESEEAKLLAKAQADGKSVEQVVREAIAPILSTRDAGSAGNKPPKSLLGIWAQYGPGPSAEEIDESRAEMFSTFGRDDIA